MSYTKGLRISKNCPRTILDDLGDIVAGVELPPFGDYKARIATAEANARLFVAAGPMLEALEAILGVMKPGLDGHDHLLHVWLNYPDKPERTPGTMARAAIKLAKEGA